jgi:hypothetical protein
VSADLTILHLYPGELGINGDRGNVTALTMRARWRGISVDVVDHSVGDVAPDPADIVHIGSGPLSSLRAVYDDVSRLAPLLRQWATDGAPILAIAGGWQLLGTELVLPDGQRLTGAGVFPTNAALVDKRSVGESLVETEWGTIAGFENHSSVTTLASGAEPLGTVIRGGGNTPATEGARLEGVRAGASIGTHLHGSVLPLNPVLADRLLTAALQRRYSKAELAETPETRLADGYAEKARAAIAARLGARVR